MAGVDVSLSYAIDKIVDLLFQEVAFLQGVREEVGWLKDELSYMRPFLQDAEAKENGAPLVRKWLSSIKDLADDVVATLEKFETKVGKQKVSKHRIKDFLPSFSKPYNLHKIGNEIESLKKRVHGISQRRETYGIVSSGEGTSNGLNQELRRTYSHADGEFVIGFADVTAALVAQLTKEEPSRSVVSIYGMGGLGKSALARKLYHSVGCNIGKFDCQAWVSVPPKYRPQDLLRSTISAFGEEVELPEDMEVGRLQKKLRDVLKSRRYLVVIDDVWDQHVWEILREAFPDDKRRSRVIITTRNKAVAVRVESFVQELLPLNPNESWYLFCKIAFPGGRRATLTLAKQDLAMRMVEKCCGLPLAIITLGKLLSQRNGLDEWQRVIDQPIWSQLKKQNPREISDLFTLSYEKLSPRKKPLFLYMGMFPEDHDVDVKKLICTWIAEEFIPMEDAGEPLFDELTDQGLIQVTGRFWEKSAKCRLHDHMRDLAIEKAREIDLFRIFPYHNPSINDRRHAIYNGIQQYISLDHQPNSRLQTLAFLNPENCRVTIEQPLSSTFRNLKSLRVLDLSGINLSSNQQLSKIIATLTKLKFLGLNNTNIVEIPSSVGKLQSLQTLEAISSQKCTMPPEISELTQLRHLHGLFLDCRLYVDNLCKLQTLGVVSIAHLLDMDLARLTELRELSLRCPTEPFSLDTIAAKLKLDTLILFSVNTLILPSLSSFQRPLKLWLDGQIVNPLGQDTFPNLLTRLIISHSKLNNDPMPILERLPNLNSLELIDSYEGNVMTCSADGFPELEVLRVSELKNLIEWEVQDGAMPLIKKLSISECSQLRTIPIRLEKVPDAGESKTLDYRKLYNP